MEEEDISSNNFEAAIARLVGLGVALAAVAVRQAKAAKIKPAEIHAIIDYAETHRHDWDDLAAVLYTRITITQPGQAASEFWPKRSEAAIKRERAAAEAASAKRKSAECDAECRRHEKEKAEAAQLESQFGGALDRLTDPEAISLLERCPGVSDLMRKIFARGRNRSHFAVREPMLRQLESEAKLRPATKVEDTVLPS